MKPSLFYCRVSKWNLVSDTDYTFSLMGGNWQFWRNQCFLLRNCFYMVLFNIMYFLQSSSYLSIHWRPFSISILISTKLNRETKSNRSFTRKLIIWKNVRNKSLNRKIVFIVLICICFASFSYYTLNIFYIFPILTIEYALYLIHTNHYILFISFILTNHGILFICHMHTNHKILLISFILTIEYFPYLSY